MIEKKCFATAGLSFDRCSNDTSYGFLVCGVHGAGNPDVVSTLHGFFLVDSRNRDVFINGIGEIGFPNNDIYGGYSYEPLSWTQLQRNPYRQSPSRCLAINDLEQCENQSVDGYYLCGIHNPSLSYSSVELVDFVGRNREGEFLWVYVDGDNRFWRITNMEECDRGKIKRVEKMSHEYKLSHECLRITDGFVYHSRTDGSKNTLAISTTEVQSKDFEVEGVTVDVQMISSSPNRMEFLEV